MVQELLTLVKYKKLELEGRLKGFDFSGMTRLTVRDGKEIKKRTKKLMTSLINGALQRKQIIFPSDDLDIEDPESRLPAIDRLEGFLPDRSSLYRRVLVPIHARESIVVAWLYIGDESLRHGTELIPTGIWSE